MTRDREAGAAGLTPEGSAGPLTHSWPASVRETPYVEDAPEFSDIAGAGVRPLFFAGLHWRGRPTRVFAWYGEPPGTGPVPAVVLVHGGGGTAFADWVRLWTARGYAAIAMDTCGCVPRGMDPAWQRHGHGGPPGWGGFDQLNDPAEDQWMHHAVADVSLAYSLIASFPRVDAARIGVTGISWGGVIAAVLAGVDPRPAFVAPVYGCGFMHEDSCFVDGLAQLPVEQRESWIARWDPSRWLPMARMPMLWINGTNDFAFPPPSWLKSTRLPNGVTTRCMKLGMVHGHHGPGETPEEIRAFADHLCFASAPLPNVIADGMDGEVHWAVVHSPAPLAARLVWTMDRGPWVRRRWQGTEARQAPERIEVPVPVQASAWYLEIMDGRGLLVSSRLHERL